MRSKEARFVFHGLVQGPNVPEAIEYRKGTEYQQGLHAWRKVFLGERYLCAWCTAKFVKVYKVLGQPQNRFCSKACSKIWQGSKEYQTTRREACLAKHGVENPAQLQWVQDKFVQTNLARRGVPFPAQDATVMKKLRETNVRRYGAACSLYGEEQQLKTKRTMQGYGVELPQQKPGNQEKREATNLRLFGVAHPAQSEAVQKKTRRTNMERYGVPHPQQNAAVRRRAQQSQVRRKTYVTADGITLTLQGCEPNVASWLESKGMVVRSAEDLKIRVAYKDCQRRTRFYFPDLCVRTLSGVKHLVEAKSTWWVLQVNVVEKFKQAQAESESRGWGDHVLVVWRGKRQPALIFKGREGLRKLKAYRKLHPS